MYAEVQDKEDDVLVTQELKHAIDCHVEHTIHSVVMLQLISTNVANVPSTGGMQMNRNEAYSQTAVNETGEIEEYT